MTTNLVAIPGYADTADYWAHLFEEAMGVPVERLRWPGLWGAPAGDGNPIDDMVTAAARASELPRDRSPALLVAHSLGCWVACEAAARGLVQGLILTAPAFGPLPFLQPSELAAWQAATSREHIRPDPLTGQPVTIEVPWSYGSALADRSTAPVPICPTLLVAMSEDARQNEHLGPYVSSAGGTLVTVDGPHRWWEHQQSAAAVLHAVAVWVVDLK